MYWVKNISVGGAFGSDDRAGHHPWIMVGETLTEFGIPDACAEGPEET